MVKINDRVTIKLEGVVRTHHRGGMCVEVVSDDAESSRPCFAITPEREVRRAEPGWVVGDFIRTGTGTHHHLRGVDGWHCTCEGAPESDEFVSNAWANDEVTIIHKVDA